MPYNGYPDQDAFHAALRAEWDRRSRANILAQNPHAFDPAKRDHSECDHAYGICLHSPVDPR